MVNSAGKSCDISSVFGFGFEGRRGREVIGDLIGNSWVQIRFNGFDVVDPLGR